MLELVILTVGAALAAAFIFLPNALQALKRQRRRGYARTKPAQAPVRPTSKASEPAED